MSRVFVMILALFGYVGTMLAAFVLLVTVWHHVIAPTQMERVRQLPHPIGAVAQDAAAAPATQDAVATAAKPATTQPGAWGPPVIHKADDRSDMATASADDARAAVEKQTADAEKTKRQRQARYQKRRERLARQQQQDQQYSTALGYDQEQSDRPRSQDYSSGPFFNPFGPRRF